MIHKKKNEKIALTQSIINQSFLPVYRPKGNNFIERGGKKVVMVHFIVNIIHGVGLKKIEKKTSSYLTHCWAVVNRRMDKRVKTYQRVLPILIAKW